MARTYSPLARGDLFYGPGQRRAHLVDFVSDVSIRALCGRRVLPRDAEPAPALSCGSCLRIRQRNSRRRP